MSFLVSHPLRCSAFENHWKNLIRDIRGCLVLFRSWVIVPGRWTLRSTYVRPPGLFNMKCKAIDCTEKGELAKNSSKVARHMYSFPKCTNYPWFPEPPSKESTRLRWLGFGLDSGTWPLAKSIEGQARHEKIPLTESGVWYNLSNLLRGNVDRSNVLPLEEDVQKQHELALMFQMSRSKEHQVIIDIDIEQI